MKKIWFLLIVPLFSLCNRHDDNNTKDSNVEVAIRFDTIAIDINATLLNKYICATIYSDLDGHDNFIAYNHKTHCFDIFDLSNSYFLKSIVLDEAGPHGVGKISQLKVFNNLIIAKSNPFLYIMNFRGELNYSINLYSDLSNFEYENYSFGRGVFVNKSSSIAFDSEKSSVFFPLYGTSESTKQAIMVCFLDSSYELVKLRTPAYLNLENYGDLSKPFIMFQENKLIYNYAAHSQVFRYDFGSKQTDVFSINSKYVPNESPKTNSTIEKEIFKHSYFSSQFYEVYFDVASKKYLRLNVAERNPKKSSEIREIYLSIFSLDTDFNLEIPLELDPLCLYPASSGVYFQSKVNYEEFDEKIRLVRMRIV
jgi:hypothetical protein